MSSAAYYRRRWHTDARFKRRKGLKKKVYNLKKSIKYHQDWVDKQTLKMAEIIAILWEER